MKASTSVKARCQPQQQMAAPEPVPAPCSVQRSCCVKGGPRLGWAASRRCAAPCHCPWPTPVVHCPQKYLMSCELKTLEASVRSRRAKKYRRRHLDQRCWLPHTAAADTWPAGPFQISAVQSAVQLTVQPRRRYCRAPCLPGGCALLAAVGCRTLCRVRGAGPCACRELLRLLVACRLVL